MEERKVNETQRFGFVEVRSRLRLATLQGRFSIPAAPTSEMLVCNNLIAKVPDDGTHTNDIGQIDLVDRMLVI